MKHGDFTDLAEKYSRYRPAYSPMLLNVFIGAACRSRGGVKQLTCADVGAGTGIWSRQLARAGANVIAIEPNDAMREQGEAANENLNIKWLKGSGEDTGLPDSSVDAATMASSFHWPDFDKATAEFQRIIKPNGLFMALWNTRRFESNPLLAEIEEYLHKLVPELKRVSSGRSEFCENLTDRLLKCGKFSDVIYLEGRHTELQSPERYIGLWESVNDIRVQAGEERFGKFINFIREKTKDISVIEAEYLTRAWLAEIKK